MGFLTANEQQKSEERAGQHFVKEMRVTKNMQKIGKTEPKQTTKCNQKGSVVLLCPELFNIYYEQKPNVVR